MNIQTRYDYNQRVFGIRKEGNGSLMVHSGNITVIEARMYQKGIVSVGYFLKTHKKDLRGYFKEDDLFLTRAAALVEIERRGK